MGITFPVFADFFVDYKEGLHIGDVLDLIQGISEQSNLLALNAAI